MRPGGAGGGILCAMEAWSPGRRRGAYVYTYYRYMLTSMLPENFVIIAPRDFHDRGIL